MKTALLGLILCFVSALQGTLPIVQVDTDSASAYYDWKQLGYDAQHTGHTPEQITPPFTNIWNIDFANDLGEPERLYPSVQPVTSADRLFIGSEHGNFYAIDLATGNRIWKYPQGADNHIGPIVSTAGVGQNCVYIASMDGRIYALDIQTGNLCWKYSSNQRTGFSTSVLLANGNVYAANRNGIVYAIRQDTGQLVWQRQLNAQIMMAPAFNNDRLYVAGMDLVLYALDGNTGTIVWQTKPGDIEGYGQTVFWPVVQAQRGLIILRPLHRFQDASVPFYRTYVFEEATGKPVNNAPSISSSFFNVGPLPAAALTQDGKVITGFGPMWAGTGLPNGFLLYDLATGNEQRLFSGTWAGDENLIPSSAGNLIFFWHPGGDGGYVPAGYFDTLTGILTYFQFGSPSTNFTGNLQSGGVSPGIVSRGYVLFVSNNQLRALKSE